MPKKQIHSASVSSLPSARSLSSDATAVELPSKSGYMEVLYGHAPLMAELGAGDVRVHSGAGMEDRPAR